jgi:hypothetical protein
MSAPRDAAGRTVLLRDFEFEPGMTIEDKLDEIRRDAYEVAVTHLDVSATEPNTDERFALWDEEADRVAREACLYYFGNTE